ncbi:metallophosphatase [Pseudoalteromonas sp. NBT06-2]|uniref:metallophosphatase n=1 Tax=Pseudoalteromonas sp. NBT06-2 TaxID=2025950 RepID=UPI000BA66533|nr:metallophosphatase [Pseudoalteromonas sp. NBT06-2]PAJ74214.1 metallophosphatase [Pseudoalteromonas sp. NBT06-2]
MLPFLIAGPMVRLATPQTVCIWLATSNANPCVINLLNHQHDIKQDVLQLGEHLFVRLIHLTPVQACFPTDELIHYQLNISQNIDINAFCYEGHDFPAFVIPHKIESLFHGSCRNPHHPSDDSLICADNYQNTQRSEGSIGTQLLLLSGDQIYADDVAGPMLQAIYQLINTLGIYKETPLNVDLSDDINQQLYHRANKLPVTPWQDRSKRTLGYWLKKDLVHFTSAKSENHLIGFEEFVAMYLLCYSKQAWQCINIDLLTFKSTNQQIQKCFDSEKKMLLKFVSGLHHSQRLYANISCLMMFDDHDVTDDWNLTANWEQNIYQNPVSRRIVANGLISYWIFQGWGNDAGQKSGLFKDLMISSHIDERWHFDTLDKEIFQFSYWHYEIQCEPKLVVLDTRTHRWRNEHNFDEPSGLLDWEQLSLLEQNLIGEEGVILISPAPVFGVKSIEAIQSLFNICGHPLLVDVENWMAHEGAARKLMNIFKRADTPVETLILSGDVHYSFCYSVQARFSQRDNRIWQLTASGIKNQFPTKLLAMLDTLDSCLYGSKSPLNFFTKRWQMKVSRHPVSHNDKKHLMSLSGISLIKLKNGKLENYEILHGNGETTEFVL